ncbi:MAG: hypothetical protein WDO68_02170 [Gammaproteobacteria bacterium]
MNLKDPIDTPFHEPNISKAFLEFAQPILGEEGSLTPEQIEQILRMAFVTWNAVVYDTVHADTEWVTRCASRLLPMPHSPRWSRN